MKIKTRRIIGNILIWSSLAYLTIHAIGKLLINSSDLQHWGVLLSVVLLIIGGAWGMRR